MRFTLPKDLYHGEHALDALKTLTGKKVFIAVGSGPMKCFGSLDKVVDCLKEVGMEVQLFEGTEPDPSIETVMKGVKAMEELNPDWIVAVGGGSPTDAAKATWVFYEYPDISSEDLVIPFNFPTLRTKAKFCAIPSTSGTAAEVTAFSIITDYSKRIKCPLADFNITPDVAIVDPALAETISKKLTTHTGVDAVTRATEVYVLTPSCEHTGSLALHTVEMVNEYLIPPYNGDMEVRNKIHNAQCLAGMAFFNALLGIVHSTAHRTSTVYLGSHIAHDYANTIYLPKVIKYNFKESGAVARYAKIAKFINPPGTTDQELVDVLIARTREMNRELDTPTCIGDYEGGIIDEKEFMEKLPAVVELAVGNACTGSNPRSITPAQMEKLLTRYFHDEGVTF